MKNHKKVNGTLLQTNKKWSHLKGKQVQYIYENTAKLHMKFVVENGRLPRKQYKDGIIDGVFEAIRIREIHIPYGEAKPNISKFIDRLNRKFEKEKNEYITK